MKTKNKGLCRRSDLSICTVILVRVYCIPHVSAFFIMAFLTCINSQNTLKKDSLNPNFQKNEALFFRVKMGFRK
jgi:hypothetical protein